MQMALHAHQRNRKSERDPSPIGQWSPNWIKIKLSATFRECFSAFISPGLSGVAPRSVVGTTATRDVFFCSTHQSHLISSRVHVPQRCHKWPFRIILFSGKKSVSPPMQTIIPSEPVGGNFHALFMWYFLLTLQWGDSVHKHSERMAQWDRWFEIIIPPRTQRSLWAPGETTVKSQNKPCTKRSLDW